MSNQKHLSHKRALIEQASSRIVVVIAVTVFVVVFCLFAIRSLYDQYGYHNRVINEKEAALDTLDTNIENTEELQRNYVNFESAAINLLGGNPEGTAPNDGSNTKIILDSLPAIYDYPALSTSIEKILVDGGYPITSLGGEAVSVGEDEGLEGVQDIPYNFVTLTSVEGARNLMDTLHRSIRPFYVEELRISGANNELEVSVALRTFYQPSKELEVDTKVVQ